MFSSLKHFAHLGFTVDVELTGSSSSSVTPTNAYVFEDSVTFYVAEDNSTFYVQES